MPIFELNVILSFGLEELRANAQLMAAAPKMLAALRAFRARINGDWDHPDLVAIGTLGETRDDVLAFADAAISKLEEGGVVVQNGLQHAR